MHAAHRSWVVVVIAIGVLGLLADGSLAAPSGPATPSLSLTYTVAQGTINNTVRLGPSLLMSGPRVVSGPYVANLSEEALYVLGINGSGTSSCGSLTAFRSNDSGLTYDGPFVSSFCLSGTFLDAVVLPNGTVVVASPGPSVTLSYDGGAHWTTPQILAGSAGVPTLTRDPLTGTLYLSWTANSPGPLYLSSSTDGGANWSAPRPILPAVEALDPSLGAAAGHLVLTFLNGSNGTDSDAVESTASADGGVGWSAPSVLEAAPSGAYLSAPTTAVSADGEFAAAWFASNGSLTGGHVVAVVSDTNGTSWKALLSVGSSAPPQYSPQYFAHIATFDTEGRLYVTWHNYSASSPLEATLNVAVSDRSLTQFNTSSFSLRFQTSAPNGTQYENLGAGRAGQVFLAWDVYGPFSNPDYGIFARSVTGAAMGSITGGTPGMELEIDRAAGNTSVASLAWTGAAVTLRSLPPDDYRVWVRSANGTALAGSMPVVAWSETNFSVRVGEEGPPPPSMAAGSVWPAIVAVAGTLGLGGLLAAVVYTRIRPETALQQKVRLLVFEYVTEHPGASFSQIRDAVGLQNGTAAYHLGVLEKQGLVRSAHQGRRRLYAASGVPSLDRGLLVSELQRSIIEAVRMNPGIGVREISRSIGTIPSSVSYNVRVLSRLGLLRTERIGARLRCFHTG